MFPKGGMKGLMKQAQQMQKKMKDMEDELQNTRIKGSASGNLVEVEANGKKEILSIKFPSKSKYFLPCVSLITTTLSLSLLAKLNVLISSTSKFILLRSTEKDVCSLYCSPLTFSILL